MSEPQSRAAAAGERWTRIDAYLGALARRRRIRRTQALPVRTQPESPRLALGTLPFAVLLSVLAVLMIAIAVAAWPPSQPRPTAAVAAAAPKSELGNAPRGWFQEAEKEFR